jgi:hypothetical protein
MLHDFVQAPLFWFSMASIHDEIEVLFSWNPPFLQPTTLTCKKPSTSTRQPTFYDKHFTPLLVLWSVKCLPSLVKDLAANVDRTLHAASETLPTTTKHFTIAEAKEYRLWNVEKTITDEKGVANFYDITASFCTLLASTLALHPKASNSEWKSLLVWTQSISSSGYAIIDGELRISRAADDEVVRHLMIMETMESKTCRIFKEIRDSSSPFGTWEIKSPFAGSHDVRGG